MQTATEYIFEQLEEQGLIFMTTKTNEMTISISASDYLDIKRLAKEMEKQQIIEAVSFGDCRGRVTTYLTDEQYYNETYGSKGSDETLKENHIVDTNEMISSQAEISDEEIENCVGDGMHDFYKGGFIEGAKWYREQLKSRQ